MRRQLERQTGSESEAGGERPSRCVAPLISWSRYGVFVILLFILIAPARAAESPTSKSPAAAGESAKSAAATLDTILTTLLADLREPHLMREWIAEDFDRVERKLSVRRYSMHDVSVRINEKVLLDTGAPSSPLAGVVLQRFRRGPDRFEIHARPGSWSADTEGLRGQKATLSFTDDDGTEYSLLSGRVLGILEAVKDTAPSIVLYGLCPREGHSEQTSRMFTEKRDTTVMTEIAKELGLATDLMQTRARYPRTLQTNQGNLEFLFQLGNRNKANVSIRDDTLYLKADPEFFPPVPSLRPHKSQEEAPKRRAEVHKRRKDSQIARRIARLNRVKADVDDSVKVHARVPQTSEYDVDFLHRRATWANYQFWIKDGILRFKSTPAPPVKDHQESRDLRNIRYSTIAADVASQHGLKTRVTETPKVHPRVVQVRENDAVFLHRIAFNARFRVAVEDDTLVFEKLPGESLRATDYMTQQVRIDCRARPAFPRKFSRSFNESLAMLRAPNRVPYLDLTANLRVSNAAAEKDKEPTPPLESRWPATEQRRFEAEATLQKALEALEKSTAKTTSALRFRHYLLRSYAATLVEEFSVTASATHRLQSLVAKFVSEIEGH